MKLSKYEPFNCSNILSGYLFCITQKRTANVIYQLCFYSDIRKKPTTMTLANICICLVAVYFFYIVGVGRAETKVACDVMTFFLHYFTLTSVVWMTVNAVQMYKAFTQVNSRTYWR